MPTAVLRNLWSLTGLPAQALHWAAVPGADPVLPSSFRVGAAAQASMAAAALAASELGHARGQERQRVVVDMTHAALECTSWFSLDGQVPPMWDKFSGLYPTADGHVRIHANFAHHRDGALGLLDLDAAHAEKADVARRLAGWRAIDFESAAAEAGMVVAALRSFDEWDVTPPAQAVAAQPVFHIERIGDADPLPLTALGANDLPLSGLCVLDLTRILAGPVATRALAAYGADVMMVSSPRLPHIAAVADTSRGKRSCFADLRTAGGRDALQKLVQGAHVFVQGYRPGGLAARGFGAEELARQRPGIVAVSLNAYGPQGPWAARRGFDSLVQTAMGFNHAEGEAAGAGEPRALPMQILDYASGQLMALAAAAAVHRQQHEGGSWHVQVSLAQTGQWLRGLGRVAGGFDAARHDIAPYIDTQSSGFGELGFVRHAVQLERTPARHARLAMPPGSHAPQWGEAVVSSTIR